MEPDDRRQRERRGDCEREGEPVRAGALAAFQCHEREYAGADDEGHRLREDPASPEREPERHERVPLALQQVIQDPQLVERSHRGRGSR